MFKYIVFRGNGLSYLNEDGRWTTRKDRAKRFDTELQARKAGDQFAYGCGVEVVPFSPQRG